MLVSTIGLRVPPGVVFFFNDTATTEIYTLSLHDALPIWRRGTTGAPSWSLTSRDGSVSSVTGCARAPMRGKRPRWPSRSEEHTSELQSRQYLVCRLLLEKKNTNPYTSLPHAVQRTCAIRP